MVPDKILNTVLGYVIFFVQNYYNLHPREVFKNKHDLIKVYCLHKRQY